MGALLPGGAGRPLAPPPDRGRPRRARPQQRRARDPSLSGGPGLDAFLAKAKDSELSPKALDLKRKQEILPYLERLHEELDIPVFYVSHAPDEVARLADHLVVMDAGRARANGPLADTLARLDLPIQLGEDLGAVIDGTVGAVDAPWHLLRVDFDGGSLWTRDPGLPVGRRVRVRVLARDVSLAREQPLQSSIQNVLQGRVEALGDDAHPGLMLVRLRLGASALVARLTRRSAALLDVTEGQTLWVQVKSVALLEQTPPTPTGAPHA